MSLSDDYCYFSAHVDKNITADSEGPPSTTYIMYSVLVAATVFWPMQKHNRKSFKELKLCKKFDSFSREEEAL